MAFKEFYGIKTVREERQADAPLSLMAVKKRTEKYEEKSNRPCGGRLYNQFHGERANLRGIFGRYTGAFDFGNAGY